jgi:hypothetical protein
MKRFGFLVQGLQVRYYWAGCIGITSSVLLAIINELSTDLNTSLFGSVCLILVRKVLLGVGGSKDKPRKDFVQVAMGLAMALTFYILMKINIDEQEKPPDVVVTNPVTGAFEYAPKRVNPTNYLFHVLTAIFGVVLWEFARAPVQRRCARRDAAAESTQVAPAVILQSDGGGTEVQRSRAEQELRSGESDGTSLERENATELIRLRRQNAEQIKDMAALRKQLRASQVTSSAALILPQSTVPPPNTLTIMTINTNTTNDNSTNNSTIELQQSTTTIEHQQQAATLILPWTTAPLPTVLLRAPPPKATTAITTDNNSSKNTNDSTIELQQATKQQAATTSNTKQQARPAPVHRTRSNGPNQPASVHVNVGKHDTSHVKSKVSQMWSNK